MRRPRALDLFCGGGGVSEGLLLAGFEVVGVDLDPKREKAYMRGPGNPERHERPAVFVRADAQAGHGPPGSVWRQMIGIESFCDAVSSVLERDGLLVSPADWIILRRWYQEGTPAELAAETIQHIRERTGLPRHLAYYSPAVDEAREDLGEMQAPGARTAEEPCDAFTLFATAGRPCLSCGFAEDDHDQPIGGPDGNPLSMGGTLG